MNSSGLALSPSLATPRIKRDRSRSSRRHPAQLSRRTRPRNWSYDSRPLGIGKLATATTTAGYSRIESYDLLSRPIQTSMTLPGGVGPFLTTKSYDGYGRLSSVQYPSTFVEGFSYNGAGYLTAINNGVGGAALWTANARDAYLNITQETAGNGVVTNLSYDPHVERLTAISAGGGAVQNKSYAWDTVGNLTQRVDSINGVTENFTYDPDNRVLTANIAGGVAKTYTYDAIGNIKTKSDVGTYSYPASGSGSVRPHAVSSIAGSVNNGPGSGGVVTNPSYGYDANGNMTSGGGRSMSYTAFNLPATIANASTTQTFAFDPEHNRISQVETSSLTGAAAGTTLYLNGGILCERFTNASTGVVTWRNYIVADGETKALVNQTANTAGPNWGAFNWEMAGQPGARNWTSSITATATLYLHSDHLGSIAAITNSSAALSEQDAYDPWGKRRNLNGTDDTLDTLTSQTTRGYTDQEELTDVALLHLNGRVYDPQLGKLTSGDPLVSQPYGTQGWNRYAYVANNPLNTTDPSGFGVITQLCTTTYQQNSSFDDDGNIVITATPTTTCSYFGDPTAGIGSGSSGPATGAGGAAPPVREEIIVTGKKKPNTITTYPPLQFSYSSYSLFALPGLLGPQSNQGPQNPCGGGSTSSGSSNGTSGGDAGATSGQSSDSNSTTVPMLVTGYDNSFQSTGKNPGDPGYGITANGSVAGPGTIAAPSTYPFGTQMYVPGYGLGTVTDRGGAIRNSHIDLWFPTTQAAINWGAQHLNVTVCKYGH